MCGIVGIQGNLDFDIDCSLKALSHRGPDANGSYRGNSTWLGHTRLSIIDLSETGNQPLSNEDGTVWITFNGEIYNSPSLRESLKSKGHLFRGRSDTEVIVHLYEEEGLDTFSKLEGMFSLGLFDTKSGHLVIARDPLGIKPLVYTELPGGFAFSSELRFLTRLREFPKEIDERSAHLYCSLNYIPAPLTIWKNAKKVMPGEYLVVDSGKVAERGHHYRLGYSPTCLNMGEAVDTLDKSLHRSVGMHLLSDVPVGVFLSGGLDSSLIAHMAALHSDEPIHTFTVTYPDFPYLDESGYAGIVAREIGSRHKEIPIRAKDIRPAIVDMCDHLDEPFGDPAILPTSLLCRLTREHVKVALSGDGGDELFGGYTKYQALKMGLSLGWAAPVIKALSHIPLSEDRTTFMGDRFRQFKKFTKMMGKRPLDMVTHLMSIFSSHEVAQLYRKSLSVTTTSDFLSHTLSEYVPQSVQGMNRYLFLDTKLVLPNDMLMKVDSASMMHSLEVRVPFLDRKLVDLVSSFPGEWKLKGLKGKFILREVAKRYLNREIVARPKKGFNVPLGEWSREHLIDLFHEAFKNRNSSLTDFLDFDFLQTLFNEHKSRKRDRFFELWNLFVFVRWYENTIG